jgi:hypothetical protein
VELIIRPSYGDKMKVFLSSTTEDLTDARLTFIKQFEQICDQKIELISYEKHGGDSILEPEDTCFELVRKCQGSIVLLDKYYGTMCKRDKNISITHAEVRESLNLGLHIIPIVCNGQQKTDTKLSNF